MNQHYPTTVMPAQAGIPLFADINSWFPAFAGMTVNLEWDKMTGTDG